MDSFIDGIYNGGTGAPQGSDTLPPWLAPQARRVLGINPEALAQPGPTQAETSPPASMSPFTPLQAGTQSPTGAAPAAQPTSAAPTPSPASVSPIAAATTPPTAQSPTDDSGKSFVNEIMNRHQDLQKRQAELDAMIKAGPQAMERPTSIWEKLGAMAVAGTTGWNSHNAEAGLKAGRSVLDIPKDEADKEYGRQLQGKEHGLAASERELEDMERSQDRSERTADRADARKDRDRQFDERESDRAEGRRQRESDSASRAADRTADNDRQNARDAATEKHWKDDLNLRRQEFNQRIAEQKDSKKGIAETTAYATSLRSSLAEADKEIGAKERDFMHKDDPDVQGELASMRRQRQDLQAEYDDVRGLMKKHLGLDHGVSDLTKPITGDQTRPTINGVKVPDNYVHKNGPNGMGWYKP